MILQYTLAVDEEIARRYPEVAEAHQREAARALARTLVEDHSFREEIIDPSLNPDDLSSVYSSRRYYRYTIPVGSRQDAETAARARAEAYWEGFQSAIKLLESGIGTDYHAIERDRAASILRRIPRAALEFAQAAAEPAEPYYFSPTLVGR